MERFRKIYQQGTIDVVEIWVDTQTGVNYVFHRNGNAAGFTPLLDKDGNGLAFSPLLPTNHKRAEWTDFPARTFPAARSFPTIRRFGNCVLPAV